MADIIPTEIPILTANAIASYDYIDLSSGLGFINYKGFTTSLSGAVVYNLGTQTVYSHTIAKTDTGADPVINFDSSPFNLPRTAKGTAYVSIGFGIVGGGTANVQCQLQKVDGSTVTDISPLTSGANIGGAGTSVGMWLVPLTLTQTTIGVGQYLRLGVTITGDGADLHEFGHDPQGRAGVIVSGASVTTALNCYVPFRIYN